ncbi:MAG: hypothetical protein REH83_04435 [Rickettsiella sp.]|nr:hypothetical protein [Rickettsiella sp.]
MRNDNDAPLTFKDLRKMDQLLKTPGTTFSSNGELRELDWLAIKVSDDIQQRPTRSFYNLRMFNHGNEKTHQIINSEKPLALSLKN